jgi:hypothetical protein
MPVGGLFLAESLLSEPLRSASKLRQRGSAGSTDWHFHVFGPHDRYPSAQRGVIRVSRGDHPLLPEDGGDPEYRTHGDPKSHPMARITNAQSIRSKYLAGSERRG